MGRWSGTSRTTASKWCSEQEPKENPLLRLDISMLSLLPIDDLLCAAAE